MQDAKYIRTDTLQWVCIQANLEQILRQLVAVHAEKLECSGGQGEAFSLPKSLGTQQAQHDGVQSMSM